VIGDEKGKLLKRRLEERKEAFIFGLPLTLWMALGESLPNWASAHSFVNLWLIYYLTQLISEINDLMRLNPHRDVWYIVKVLYIFLMNFIHVRTSYTWCD
jgi:hypothetical protein